MNESPKNTLQRDILPGFSVFGGARRFGEWFFSRRILRRVLIVGLWLVTLVALFYGEERWRGRRAWSNYRRELERRGEQLELQAFIPKAVPDDQNFAATPFVQSWFTFTTNSSGQRIPVEPWRDSYAAANTMISDRKLQANRRHFLDLVAWAKAFEAVRTGKEDAHQNIAVMDHDLKSRAEAAPAVLEGLKTNASALAELRTASTLPFSRYPIAYNLDNPWAILLPHLAKMKGACSRLELRASAELALGQNDQALEDVKLILYLADSVKDEPFLISYLVRLATLQIAVRPIWEGLTDHHWSDAQLKELQGRLQQYDLLADLQSPLRSERASGVLTVDLLERGKYNLNGLESPESEHPVNGPTAVGFIGKIVPGGWYYLERLNYCLSFDTLLNGTVDPSGQRVLPDRIASNSREFERQLFGGHLGRAWNVLAKHRLIAALLLPALGKVTQKAAQAQTVVNQAIVACALERYRLDKGNFPEKLEDVTPQTISHLPHDVINGEPFHYRRANEQAYLLYSVGWNQRDDGGKPGQTLFDDKDGDWFWSGPIETPDFQVSK